MGVSTVIEDSDGTAAYNQRKLFYIYYNYESILKYVVCVVYTL